MISSNMQMADSGSVSLLSRYATDGFFDELVDHIGKPRQDAMQLVHLLSEMDPTELMRRHRSIEKSMYQMGVTFTVYGDAAGTEKIMPFDIVPRIISAVHWQHIEAGLKQRIKTLNLFLSDIYGEQRIIHDGIIPREVVESASGFLPQCVGLKPVHDVWCHVAGSDLIRDETGAFYVLEDNVRCPSGVSYVLQNRAVMKSNFPDAFRATRVRAVGDYPARLYERLASMAPAAVTDPKVVVLTPGRYNSAYYEHAFLAQQMGVQLVEGTDLIVDNDTVFMLTTGGPTRVDVIYRRIDDLFLDPEVFRKDSFLGIKGLMRAYQSGNVALANAPGTGVADDKVIYAYVPEMIRYYLGETQILPNVPTYICAKEEEREFVLSQLDELVVKAADESGGYGILIGPHASPEQRQEFAARIIATPRKYVAQPTLSLSRVPTMIGDQLEGRHVDLRPYILCGSDDIWVMPGGLTRVALNRGSLVVNSSQGGGSKDTWVASH